MSQNYSKTINLPKTSFPMKASLPQKEPIIYDFWNKIHLYQKILDKNSNNSKYILHDGPPYANGSIHIGHALNKILKDMIIKYKMLQGYYTPYIPGWDCHGLPIEHQLMQDLNTTKHDVDPNKFRKKAQKFASKFVAQQRDEFCRLGVLGDWDHPYLTLHPYYEYGIIKVLYDLVDKGYIYRNLRPVSWCTHCETALADAEIEYKDKKSDAIFVKFKLLQPSFQIDNVQMQSKDIFFIAWTTTPWTLPANVGLMLHPEIQYALVHMLQKDEIWIMSKETISKIFCETLHLTEGKDYSILQTQLGKRFVGSTYGRLFPQTGHLKEAVCIESSEVAEDEGTGIVHIATGHGTTDYFEGYIKNHLKIISLLTDRGVYSEELQYEDLINVSVPYVANEKIIQILIEKNLLVNHTKIVHSYPHCWRCLNPIVYRATYQWFLNIDHCDLRQRLLSHIDQLNFIPKYGRNRIYNMVKNRPDWCISRQKIWGTPIPIVYCADCSKIIINPAFVDSILTQVKSSGSSFWFELSLQNILIKMGISSCPYCQSTNIAQEKDILDVWFDSGSSFQSVLKDCSEWDHKMTYPADLYLEGSDQHRGWFQSSLILSVATGGISPYKSILTHGFIVDAEGKKMSKSRKNVINPEVIIKQYGADILRLTLAITNYQEDIRLSDVTIQRSIDYYRKIRNTIRYILGNLDDFSIKDQVSYCDMHLIDQMMLAKISTFFKQGLTFCDQFLFYKLISIIVEFCSVDCSAVYFDFSKDILYTEKSNSLKRRSVQTVLYYILKHVVFLLAPVLSFTGEEIWQIGIKKGFWTQESIFLNQKLECPDEFNNQEYVQYWQVIKELRTKINLEIEKNKQLGRINSSTEAHVRLCLSDKNTLHILEKFKDDLHHIFLVASVEYTDGPDVDISIQKSGFEKCVRCWRYTQEILRTNSQEDPLCVRCYHILFEHA